MKKKMINIEKKKNGMNKLDPKKFMKEFFD